MSISSRKEREKEQRRNDILQAAEKLFFARGYDNVTMDDIAKEVELNKATIYLYFFDKESLYYTVVLRGVQILNEMVKERERNATTGFDKLWEIGHAYFSFVKRHPDYNVVYSYFYSGRFDLTDLRHEYETPLSPFDSGESFWRNVNWAANWASKEVARLIIDLNHEIFVLMCNAIKAGIEEGTFRRDLDPEEAAIVFSLLLESIPRMRPDLEKVLDGKGVGQRTFERDIGDFMGHMLMNKAKRS
jgi:AcrR family transcriptional regulator